MSTHLPHPDGNLPVDSMSDEELREEVDYLRALQEDPSQLESVINPGVPSNSKLEQRLEDLEDEMGRRKLDHYPMPLESSSNIVPPLAATSVRGSTYQRPGGGIYLRPSEALSISPESLSQPPEEDRQSPDTTESNKSSFPDNLSTLTPSLHGREVAPQFASDVNGHDAFEKGIRELEVQLNARFAANLKEYLRIVFSLDHPPGITTVRLVLGIFQYAPQAGSSSLFHHLALVVEPHINGLENIARRSAQSSSELNEIQGTDAFISKTAMKVLQAAVAGENGRYDVEAVEVIRGLLVVKPTECNALQTTDEPFWNVFKTWVTRANVSIPPTIKQGSLKMLWDIQHQYPLSREVVRFIEWTSAQGTSRDAIGAIGPASLHAFFAGWVQTQNLPLAKIIEKEFNDKPRIGVGIGIELLETYQSTPSTSGFPYITDKGEEVFAEARALLASSHEQIEPNHLYAGILVIAAKSKNADTLLAFSEGRFTRLFIAFVKQLKESGLASLAAKIEAVTLAPETALNHPSSDEDNKQIRNNTPNTSESASSPEVLSNILGTQFNPRREASAEELCLNADAYAAAIAETFCAASDDDDFVFALYGPWGRGKSRQMKEVKTRLEGDNTKANPGHGYKCLFFSAWKYPTRPEVWVHLYQCVAKAAHDGGFWQKLRIGFRVGLLKNGWWPLWIGFGFLALSRVQIDFAYWLFEGVGILGLIIIGSFAWNATKLGKAFAHSYIAMPDHRDKLGLQAVIGDDLANLLQVWTKGRAQSCPKKSACDFSYLPTRLSLLLVISLAWLTLYLVYLKIDHQASKRGNPATTTNVTLLNQRSVESFAADGSTSQPSSAASTPNSAATQQTPFNKVSPRSIGLDIQWQDVNLKFSGMAIAKPADNFATIPDASSALDKPFPLLHILLYLVAFIFSALAFFIARNPAQCRQALLIVDDLDRCDPDQMLAVIESIRLFLDDPAMSQRLQVAMLTDKALLEGALKKRCTAHRILLRSEIDRHHLRSVREKYFVAEFTLPPLDSGEIKDLATLIVDKEYRSQLEAEKQNPPQAAQPDSRKPEHFSGEEEIAPPTISSNQVVNANIKAPASSKNELHVDINATNSSNDLSLSTPSRDLSNTSPPTTPPLDELKFTFSDRERKSLKQVISTTFNSSATPRSIRAFIFRYQLARLLLQHLKREDQDGQLANALAEALHGSPDTVLENVPPEIRWAVQHVI